VWQICAAPGHDTMAAPQAGEMISPIGTYHSVAHAPAAARAIIVGITGAAAMADGMDRQK